MILIGLSLRFKGGILSHPPTDTVSVAFEWKKISYQEKKKNPTHTVFPQRFREFWPFCSGATKDLRNLKLEQGTILQYVDDILVCSPSQELTNTLSTYCYNVYTYIHIYVRIYLHTINSFTILTFSSLGITFKRAEKHIHLPCICLNVFFPATFAHY